MSRAIDNYLDRERPVSGDDMSEKKPIRPDTTEELRAAIANMGADVVNSADQSFEYGWHDCAEGTALPIAEERDALAAEVERLRALIGFDDVAQVMRGRINGFEWTRTHEDGRTLAPRAMVETTEDQITGLTMGSEAVLIVRPFKKETK